MHKFRARRDDDRFRMLALSHLAVETVEQKLGDGSKTWTVRNLLLSNKDALGVKIGNVLVLFGLRCDVRRKARCFSLDHQPLFNVFLEMAGCPLLVVDGIEDAADGVAAGESKFNLGCRPC